MGRRSIYIRSSYCLGFRYGGMGGVLSTFGPVTVLVSGTYGVLSTFGPVTDLASGTGYNGVLSTFGPVTAWLRVREWGGVLSTSGPVTDLSSGTGEWGGVLSTSGLVTVLASGTGAWGGVLSTFGPVMSWFFRAWGGVLSTSGLTNVLASGAGDGAEFSLHSVAVTVFQLLQVRGHGLRSVFGPVTVLVSRYVGTAFYLTGFQLLQLGFRYWGMGRRSVIRSSYFMSSGTGYGRRSVYHGALSWLQVRGAWAASVYMQFSYCLGFRYGAWAVLSTSGLVTVLAAGTGGWGRFCLHSSLVAMASGAGMGRSVYIRFSSVLASGNGAWGVFSLL
ncbi:hypothetical protein AVEN_126561-1 [Araneus ventricosus]|uniref:Uncharacterized protein n=1 Tax=Araneus ventricosus TaxID=182803 RepID=A0A4Y2LG92_ARAVE|nr:hypothetical protein AVEN_126561-1 [Araneus ventricosus]